MSDAQFNPRNLRIEPRTKVTWFNLDDDAHTVTAGSDDRALDLEVPGGETLSHVFRTEGLYEIYCRFHGADDLSGMSMKVGVGTAIEDRLGQTGDGGGGGGDGGGYY